MEYAPPQDVAMQLEDALGAHEISTRALAGGAGVVIVIKRVATTGASSFVIEPDATRARIDALWRGWWRNLASGAATHARRSLRLA